VGATNNGDGTWTLASGILAPLAEGSYDIGVVATDWAGNIGSATLPDGLVINEAALSVLQVTRLHDDPTTRQTVDYLVEFSSVVLNIATGIIGPFNDFSVDLLSGNLSGVAVVAVIPESPSTFRVTVDTGEGDGVLRLRVLSSGGLQNLFGAPLPTDYTGAPAYTVERDDAPPEVLGITVSSVPPGQALFTVQFSEEVMGVPTGSTGPFPGFALTQVSGSLSGSSIEEITAIDALNYAVRVNPGTGEGAVRLDVLQSGPIVDSQGQGLAADFTTGPAYTVNSLPPFVESLLVEPATPGVGSRPTLHFTFSESMDTSVAPDVVVHTASNGAIAASSVAAGGNGGWTDQLTYRVTVDRALVAADHGVAAVAVSGGRDIHGNVMDPDSSHSFFINGVAPAITVNDLVTDSTQPTITGTVGSNPPAASILVMIDGQTKAAFNHGDGTWSVFGHTLSPLAIGDYQATAIATDSAGNTSTATGQVSIDPSHLDITAWLLDPSPTNLPVVRFRIEFSSNVTGFETGTIGPFDAFEPLESGGISGARVSAVSILDLRNYIVFMEIGEGSGTLGLRVRHDTGLVNASGLPPSAPLDAQVAYTISRIEITAQPPPSVLVETGDSLTLQVAATGGSPPYDYEWRYEPGGNVSVLVGTSPTLHLNNLQYYDVGYYFAYVSDANETVRSDGTFVHMDVLLPAAGVLGLLLLVLLLAGGAVWYWRAARLHAS